MSETSTEATKFVRTQAETHIHPEYGIVQVGWLGQTGRVYDLDENPAPTEPGSFAPLYAPWGEECGHMIRAREAEDGGHG